MWLTCGHLSAKPPGCTMAWLCVCVCRGGGNGRAVGLASERSHSLSLSLSPPLLPSFLLLAAHNPSVIVSFFFISLPWGAVWSDWVRRHLTRCFRMLWAPVRRMVPHKCGVKHQGDKKKVLFNSWHHLAYCRVLSAESEPKDILWRLVIPVSVMWKVPQTMGSFKVFQNKIIASKTVMALSTA